MKAVNGIIRLQSQIPVHQSLSQSLTADKSLNPMDSRLVNTKDQERAGLGNEINSNTENREVTHEDHNNLTVVRVPAVLSVRMDILCLLLYLSR